MVKREHQQSHQIQSDFKYHMVPLMDSPITPWIALMHFSVHLKMFHRKECTVTYRHFTFNGTNSRYPHDKIDPEDGPYVMQAAQLIQGSPHAANRWQENLSLQLKNMGFIRNNVDHLFHIKYDQENNI